MDGLVMVAVEQGADRVPTLADSADIAQWPVQPAAQEASTHGRGRAIHYPRQGMLLAAIEVGVDLQIAPAGRIHEHAFLTAFPGEPANVRKLVTLGVPRVLEQAACRLDGQCQVLAAEAAQVLDLELAGQRRRWAESISKCQGPWRRMPV